MPKSKAKAGGIPKSVLSDLNRIKTRVTSLEKMQSMAMKEFKATMKSHTDMMKKHEQMISQLGKKPVKKEKRKPSPYNLFLKDKMSQGMSMVDAVKAWKEKEGGMSSSMRPASTEWQSTTQQY